MDIETETLLLKRISGKLDKKPCQDCGSLISDLLSLIEVREAKIDSLVSTNEDLIALVKRTLELAGR